MRYAVNGVPAEDTGLSFDVLIVGSGIAGLYTALNLKDGASCCILTKESVEISNSYLAQGGIAAAISRDDNPDLHLNDTLLAGAGLCHETAVRVLVEEGPSDIRTLVEMRVPFDLSVEGDLQITREGGHRKNRVVHAGGDATGRETVKALAKLVSDCDNVTFMGHSFFVDILTNKDRKVTGALILDSGGKLQVVHCPNVVIATGGIGQSYKASTNPAVATGDGIAAAVRAGAKLRDMEFIQFHPTGLWSESHENRAFLISEAVRGEGGLLKNKSGERFMDGKHELNELAPRDIVARGIVNELERSGESHVYIDITDKPEEYLSRRFPTIYNECLGRGINISKDWIPVVPVQHYLIGGIETDLHGRTNLPGLYACGEAASTGVHGANRLASNSMLECLVFGRRAAQDINLRLIREPVPEQIRLVSNRSLAACELDLAQMRQEIQMLMSEYCFVTRCKEGLSTALCRTQDIKSQLESCRGSGREYIEDLNVATIAAIILESALTRENSVGAHYRSDI